MKELYYILLTCGLLGGGYLSANPEYVVEPVKTHEAYRRVLRDNKLVVAYLYSLTDKDRQAHTQWKALPPAERVSNLDSRQSLIEKSVGQLYSVAEMPSYDKADVKFITVNTENGDLHRLKKEYSIPADDALLFIVDGKNTGMHKVQAGFEKNEIFDFFQAVKVDDFVDEEIKQKNEAAREQAAAEEARERAERRYYRRPSMHFGFGSRYPDYRYSYSPWGWPSYRHYRYGWGRPGFGIGFSI